MLLHKYDIIILDCDGVIFDSNFLKLEAFRNALISYDKKIVDQFIEYFGKNFGTSRYNLTKVFIESFLNVKFDNDLYQNILTKYSKNCILLYQKSELTKNFTKFIEEYKYKDIYVVSASDQEELRLVMENRGLSQYFLSTFGSPKSKINILKDIVSKNNSFVMIGDSASDIIAARETKIDFIFMKSYSANKDIKIDKDMYVIDNLGDLIE